MSIPKIMQEKYDEIAPLIIAFCDVRLNAEYKELCLKLLEKLCRKKPSPLLTGKAATWAAGIVYCIGQMNFIFDKSQEIHMTADALAEPFGVKKSTASSKASEITRLCKMSVPDIEWMLPKLVKEFSFIEVGNDAKQL